MCVGVIPDVDFEGARMAAARVVCMWVFPPPTKKNTQTHNEHPANPACNTYVHQLLLPVHPAAAAPATPTRALPAASVAPQSPPPLRRTSPSPSPAPDRRWLWGAYGAKGSMGMCGQGAWMDAPPHGTSHRTHWLFRRPLAPAAALWAGCRALPACRRRDRMGCDCACEPPIGVNETHTRGEACTQEAVSG